MAPSKPWFIGGVVGLTLAGLYLLFAANVGVREYVAAVVSGGLATTGAMIFARAGGVAFRLRLRDVAQAWRVPWQVLSGTAQVLRGLGALLFARESVAGVWATARFDFGERDNPADAGRRALAETYTTATPNSIVTGIIEQPPTLLYHQLVPGSLPVLTQRLGAHP